MSVTDIFSKRQQRQSRLQPDVFFYDELPQPLRIQVVHIIRDLMGEGSIGGEFEGQYKGVHDKLAREYGLFKLAKGDSPSEVLVNFVLNAASPAQVLDCIELCIAKAQTFDRYDYDRGQCSMRASEAAKEFNFRFMEAGFGYQYENGQMIRLDSQYVHAEVVKPALMLLSNPQYSGAEEEFRNAHQHYREGNYKESMTDCLKAFESTMKAICGARGWAFQKTDTAKTLIDICLKNGVIDPMLLSHVGALRTVLEAGVPTLRNKLSGHGQGASPVSLPPHYAAYALHLTAANIVFLVTAERALP